VTERQLRVAQWAMAGAWVAAVIVASLQAGARHNNNFEIFRTSFHNLVAGRNLYVASVNHYDFFKYSPTFALLFAPFAIVPFTVGMFLWNAVNAGALYWSLGRVLDPPLATAARGIVFLEALGSMQNAQSNALSAGLMILAFSELERRRELTAALAVAYGTLIKIFPLAAAVFALFRPYRLKNFALYGIMIAAMAIVAPLMVTSPDRLGTQYRGWEQISKTDALTRGYSVMEHVHLLTGTDWPNWPIQLLGLVILLAPLIRFTFWGHGRFRLLFLASVLMFCVLFNHKAESPTFVVALAGVAIWFLVVERGRLAWAALTLVVVLCVLSPTDVMPERLQQNFFQPYKIRTLPVLLVWILVQVELWSGNRSETGSFAIRPRPEGPAAIKSPEPASAPSARTRACKQESSGGTSSPRSHPA
jgi:hypothetical protein